MHATKQPHQYKCTIICYTNKESELKLSQREQINLEKGKKKKRASDRAGLHKFTPADMGLHPHPAQWTDVGTEEETKALKGLKRGLKQVVDTLQGQITPTKKASRLGLPVFPPWGSQ